jgi:hypothetical protein
MDLFLAVALKPLVAVLLLTVVLLLAELIHRKMRPGRLKTLLFRPLPGHRQRTRWGGATLDSSEVGREQLK